MLEEKKTPKFSFIYLFFPRKPEGCFLIFVDGTPSKLVDVEWMAFLVNSSG